MVEPRGTIFGFGNSQSETGFRSRVGTCVSWDPYYAGFSERFAERLIASARLNTASIVSDPWNGSGNDDRRRRRTWT